MHFHATVSHTFKVTLICDFVSAFPVFTFKVTHFLSRFSVYPPDIFSTIFFSTIFWNQTYLVARVFHSPMYYLYLSLLDTNRSTEPGSSSDRNILAHFSLTITHKFTFFSHQMKLITTNTRQKKNRNKIYFRTGGKNCPIL